MTRIEVIQMGACMALHASSNETQGRSFAKDARRAGEFLADELGLVAEVKVEVEEVPDLVQADLDAANTRIAVLEAELEQLRDAAPVPPAAAPPPLVGPKARR